MTRRSRREFLALAVASRGVAAVRRLGGSPEISVQDFAQYPHPLTPASDFYVRNHFDTPAADPHSWRLRAGGLLSHARAFTHDELRAMNQRSVTAVLECAGNGPGVGAVGCAKWEGVPLSEILRGCGVAPEAKFVRLTGLDSGAEPDAPRVRYSRCLA